MTKIRPRPGRTWGEVPPLAKRIAVNVERLRTKSKLSVAQCCEITGVSVAHWYRIEWGEVGKFDVHMLDAIAALFRVDPIELLRKVKK